MAASAEALLNTLAGGSDVGSEETSGDTAQSNSDGATGHLDANRGNSQQPANQLPEAEQAKQHDAPADDAGSGAGKPTAEQLYQQSMAANRETRAENKALKQQLQELTAKIEALSKPPAKTEEAPPEPDFLADPKAYVDDTRKQIKELTEKLDSKEKQQTEAQQQQQQAQETWNKVLSAEAEFAAATPDYHDALNHVRGIRAEQIKIEIRETEDREATPQEAQFPKVRH